MKETLLAHTAMKGSVYFCPHCHDEVILKQGRVRVPHFAHKNMTDCPLSITESIGHIEMKAYISQALSIKYPNTNVEVPIGNRIVDIVVRDSRGNSYAVECQYSPTTVQEWEERTRFINTNQMAVIWAWSSMRFKLYGESESKIPQDILNCHKLAFGKVYYFNHELKRLFACHLEPVTRWKDTAYDRDGNQVGGYSVRLKTVRNTKFVEVPLRIKEYKSSNHIFRLAELGEGVFWEPAKPNSYSY